MIGMDPDKYAVGILAVSKRGPEVLSGGFYGNLPLFYIYFSSVMEITGLDPDIALQLSMTILYSAVPVLTVAFISKRLFSDQAVKIGSVIATAGGATILYSSLTIPQSHMILIWYLIAGLVIINKVSDWKYVGLFVLLSVATTGIHKLGALLPLAGVGGILIMAVINQLRGSRNTTQRTVLTYVMVLTLFLTIQMVYITEWAKAIGLKLRYIFISEIDQTVTVTAATEVSGITHLLLEHGSWIVLLLFAGTAWLWWAVSQSNKRLYPLLGVTAVSAAFIIFAVATPFSMSVERAIAIGEPFFVILIVGGITAVGRTRISVGAKMIVAMLLIAQLGTAAAVPDHPSEIREYLNDEEVDARDWANKHVEADLYGQYFVAQEIVDYDGSQATFKTGAGGGFADGWAPISRYLVTNDIESVDGCIFLRTNQNRVRYVGLYTLDYDPLNQLDYSKRHKLYSSAGVSTYC
jgi:hypothetical protein